MILPIRKSGDGNSEGAEREVGRNREILLAYNNCVGEVS